MATSGTATFNLAADEILETAFSRVGGEDISGFEARQARVALNLLMLELYNRRIPIHSVERYAVPLVVGIGTYTLPADTVDVRTATDRKAQSPNRLTRTLTNPLSVIAGSTAVTVSDPSHGAEVADIVDLTGVSAVGGITPTGNVIITSRTDNTWTFQWTAAAASTATGGGTVTAGYLGMLDIALMRMSQDTYAQSSIKTLQAQTSQWYLAKDFDAPRVKLFPLPFEAGHVLMLWRERRIQDISALSNDLDLPIRFMPCVIAGLAHHLAQMRPQIDAGRRAELKASFEQELSLASKRDVDGSPVSIQPNIAGYFR
jgi:hypothetical protein